MTETALPLDWIILKLSQICNLDCSYCYVYHRGDDSWQRRPKFIAPETVALVARRVNEHCQRHELEEFVIELHGGEPLLIGKRRFGDIIDTFRSTCRGTPLRFVLQTNGTLLDAQWMDLFAAHGVSFGISIDGPPEVHDRHRVDRKGRGSSAKILGNIAHLRATHPDFERLFGGVLCVVDPAMHGGDLVHWFVGSGFSSFEFLLPDATHRNPPAGWTGPEPYRRFLVEAFHAWDAMGREAPRIRMFESMMAGFLGHKPTLDALGGDIRRLCVVESDGRVGVSDVLRICSAYAIDTLSLQDSPLDAHVEHYDVARLQRACGECRACPFFTSCGGGYLPHRHDGDGFDNPSIYCDALFGVLKEMHDALRRDTPPGCWTAPPVHAGARRAVRLEGMQAAH